MLYKLIQEYGKKLLFVTIDYVTVTINKLLRTLYLILINLLLYNVKI